MQQLNDKPTEQQLLKNEIAQDQSNVKKLLDEKNILHERVIQLRELNTTCKLMEDLQFRLIKKMNRATVQIDNIRLKKEKNELIEFG